MKRWEHISEDQWLSCSDRTWMVGVTSVTIKTGSISFLSFLTLILKNGRSMAVIDPSGKWLGETDHSKGSARIRTNCVPGVPDIKPYHEIEQATADPA